MIIITGIKGFIGSHLASYLKERGFEVVGIDDDVRDIEKLRPFFKNVEFVIHAAARVNGNRGDYFEINVGGTMNIIRLCLENKTKLIYFGSIYTKGEYGISKQIAQELVRLYSQSMGLKAITFKLCGIFDDEGRDNRGKKVMQSENYPIKKLVADVENIIRKFNFDSYKIFELRTQTKPLKNWLTKIVSKKLRYKFYGFFFRLPYVMHIVPIITRRLDRYLANKIVSRIPNDKVGFDAVIVYRNVKMKIYTGESMGKIMYYFGDWEPKQNEFFEAYIKPGMLFFDIGSNMGFYSLYAATHGARSIAFEPDPEIAVKYLKINAELNEVSDKITIVNEAVADRSGRQKFYLHRPGSWGAGRIFRMSDENNPAIDVTTNSIDNYVQIFGRPDVIKMDIEGAEYYALQGASNIFSKQNAPDLMIEFHPGEIIQASEGKSSMNKIIDSLKGYGYVAYKIFELKEQNPTWFVFSKKGIPDKILSTFTKNLII